MMPLCRRKPWLPGHQVASESSDGEVAHDGPGIGRNLEFWLQSICAICVHDAGAAEILSESSLASYTLEFEASFYQP